MKTKVLYVDTTTRDGTQGIRPMESRKGECLALMAEGAAAHIQSVSEAGIKDFDAASIANGKVVPIMSGAEEWLKERPRVIAQGLLLSSGEEHLGKAREMIGTRAINALACVMSTDPDFLWRNNFIRKTDDGQPIPEGAILAHADTLASISMARYRTMLDLARTTKVPLHVYLSMATGGNAPTQEYNTPEKVAELISRIELRTKRSRVIVSDTKGCGTEASIAELMEAARGAIGNREIGFHPHMRPSISLEDVTAYLRAAIKPLSGLDRIYIEGGFGSSGGCIAVSDAPANLNISVIHQALLEIADEIGVVIPNLNLEQLNQIDRSTTEWMEKMTATTQ